MSKNVHMFYNWLGNENDPVIGMFNELVKASSYTEKDNKDNVDNEEECRNYCLINLKHPYKNITGDIYNTIVGDGDFDIMYWKENQTIDVGTVSLDVDNVLSIQSLSEVEYFTAKEYGHFVV